MQSLRLRLITPFVAGTIVLTLLLASYTYISSRQAVTDAVLLIAEAKTNEIVNSIKILFNSMNSNIHHLAADQHLAELFDSNGDKRILKETKEWLTILTNNNEYYREVIVLDTEGICIASSNTGHIGRSYTQDYYAQEALMGRFLFDDSSIGRVTLRFSTSIAGPIVIRNKIVGALLIQNDLPQVVNYRSEATFDTQTVSSSLLTEEGLFTAHKNKKLIGNKSKLYPQLYKKLYDEAARGNPIQYEMNGEEYIGYARLDPFTNWMVITSGKKTEVFASAYKTGLTVLGISCLFLFLITSLVVLFANGILSSLLSLISYAKAVSEGNLQLDLKTTTRKDELGILHKALQHLVFTLRTTLAETQKASTMKGQFLANMSHEIRTPLNAIIGISHITLSEPDLSERVRDFIKKIQLSGHSLLGLINDILDVSKIEAGMLSLETISFNLEEIGNNAIRIQQDNAKKKGVDLRISYPKDMPHNYVGDPLRIGQVLNNLLGNALKFTKDGEVAVEYSKGLVPKGFIPDPSAGDLPKNAECIWVHVTDTGIGMTETVMASLFKPFVQADASTTRQFGGTGLGLAISSQLIKLLHGDIFIKSTVGEGTCFSFFIQLPISADDNKKDFKEVDIKTAFSNMNLQEKTILVAEDNLINQMIMRELLKPTKANIIIANNGQEAVDIVKEKEINIVFMDLQMPVLDGLQATSIIREFATSEMLPIVAVTANAMKEDKEKGFARGMDSYITKPLDPKQLLSVLREYFPE